jgi:hypothetical protein
MLQTMSLRMVGRSSYRSLEAKCPPNTALTRRLWRVAVERQVNPLQRYQNFHINSWELSRPAPDKF